MRTVYRPNWDWNAKQLLDSSMVQSEVILVFPVSLKIEKTDQGSSSSKKKKKKKKEKAPERRCPYLLYGDEPCTPLTEFFTGLADDIISKELPPGEGPQVPADVPGMLIPVAQDIFFKTIHLVVNELEAGYHFTKLSESNFFVTGANDVKIKKNKVEKARTAEDRESTIRQLKEMLERVLLEASPLYKRIRIVNPELSHLFALMRDYKDGSSTLFLIKYPFCLLPVSNRGPAFIRLYDHTFDVLRVNDPVAYMMVVDGMDIPQDWYSAIGTNIYLAESRTRGFYDLNTTIYPSTFEPQLAPLRFLRDRPSHSQEGAASLVEPGAVNFTPSDLARATYIRMPWAFVSMQKSLQFVGQLDKIDGFVDLFPGRPTPRLP